MDARWADWWQTRWFAGTAILFACVPLVWPPFPPLTDALGHAGRFRMILDGNTGPLAQWYAITWKPVGNIGVDVLIALIGPLIGLEPAVKAVTIGIVALTVTGCLAISRVVHGRVSPFALFALPLVYNHGFNMGFLNFSLAMALTLNAFALWLWMTESRWHAAVFVPLSVVIWGSHVFGWAVLGLIVFATEWFGRRNPIRAAFACWPLATPLPLMLMWRAASTGETFGFFRIGSKLVVLLMSFRDTWMTVDVLTFGLVLVTIAYGARRGALAKPVGWAALALLAAFVALPIWLMGSAFADARAAPFALILGLLALRPIASRQARIVASLGLAFFVARIGATTASLALASQAQAREAVALRYVPIGSRVVQFVSPDCASGWRVSRIEHIGGLAQARRGAFTNNQWADVGASLLAIHYPAAGAFDTNPSHLLVCNGGADLARRLASFPRKAFDRLWLVDIPQGVPQSLPGMTRLWTDGNSAVYRIERR